MEGIRERQSERQSAQSQASILVGAADHAPDEEPYLVIVEEQEAPSTGHDAAVLRRSYYRPSHRVVGL